MGYYAMIPLWSEQDNAVKKGQEHHSEKTAKQCDGKTPSLNLPKIYFQPYLFITRAQNDSSILSNFCRGGGIQTDTSRARAVVLVWLCMQPASFLPLITE